MAALLAATVACSNSTQFSTATPAVPASKAIITINVLGAEPDVVFTHEAHADYWQNNCLECHSHSNIRDNSIWTCDSEQCHTEEDTEGICANDASGHDCMFVQCLGCHQNEPTAPQADECGKCHMIFLTGTFHDAPVDGLLYRTITRLDMTAGGGHFQYRQGETIEFSINGLSLGSGIARPDMTPLDLVPGAGGVSDDTVTNIARFLLTMDVNGDSTDGVTIPAPLHDIPLGSIIDFSQNPAAFGTDAGLATLLADLNSGVYGTVFSNPPHSLVSATNARAHLQSTIDSLFPAPAGVTVTGAPNTQLLLEAAHVSAPGTSYSYQWYRAISPISKFRTAITGATARSYQPTDTDAGYYLGVTVREGAYGSPAWSNNFSGPVSTANPYTYYATIGSTFEVDRYAFPVTSAANDDVTVDLESYEGIPPYAPPDYYHYRYSSCTGTGCHNGVPGPLDLGFPADPGGYTESNDYLVTNIFLFDTGGTLLDARDCDPCALGYGCYPGCDAPGVGVSRNSFNPYFNAALTTGQVYYLKVGAAPLSSTDARNENNTSGYYYNPTGAFNYRITFSFQ